ncbi:MAG: SDR family oxidoreductase [Actinobacteria bacterium]|nr:SDR family oxidoreductase [Actinomycetota bacterium]
MKVLVVGGAGFLGSATARALQEKCHEVVIASHRISQVSEWSSGLKIVKWDARNDWTLDEIDFDVILHFAGPSDDLSTQDASANASRTTQRVISLSRRTGSSVLYVSTFQVFGRWSGLIRSTDEANPVSVYGQSHLQNEVLLKTALAEVPRGLLIVRPTNIVGLSANPSSTQWHRVPAEFCLQAASSNAIQLRSDSQTQRDFLSVTVFANRIASLVETHRHWDGRAVTIGAGKSYSLLQIAKLVRESAEEVLRRQILIIESSSNSAGELLQIQAERWNEIDLVSESKPELLFEIKNLLLLAQSVAAKQSLQAGTKTRLESTELA